MYRNYRIRKLSLRAFLLSFTNASTQLVFAQASGVPLPPPAAAPPAPDQTWWYVMLFILAAGLAATVIWFMRSKAAEKELHAKEAEKLKERQESWEANSVDMNEEMAWLRGKQVVTENKHKKDLKQKKQKLEALKAAKEAEAAARESKKGQRVLDTELLKGFAPGPLPVFSFNGLNPPKDAALLPLSNDESLMNAIEQAQDEDEEDEEVRDLSLRILMAFRTRNSVEAVSQIALYDLSSSLRSKAVGVLADFDHESVFETLLLCCADPSQQVRAAAARAVTRLNVDRTDAWTRIVQSGDSARIGQAAYAAKDAGFVDRAFDRLVHRDPKMAEEAFALLALLIKAGKTETLDEAVATHPDMNVRQAILHVLKVFRDQKKNEAAKTSTQQGNPAENFPLDNPQMGDEVNLVF
jgi:hypothetical protein